MNQFTTIRTAVITALSSYQEADVDDALSEVWIRFLERGNVPDLQGRDLVKFLVRCVRNQIRSTYRKRDTLREAVSLAIDAASERIDEVSVTFQRDLSIEEQAALRRQLERIDGIRRDALTNPAEYLADWRTMKKLRSAVTVSVD
jgi:DNA-directed RNA polymerase specialized sigma24 family protein